MRKDITMVLIIGSFLVLLWAPDALDRSYRVTCMGVQLTHYQSCMELHGLEVFG